MKPATENASIKGEITMAFAESLTGHGTVETLKYLKASIQT